MTLRGTSFAGPDARVAGSRRRERVSLERWIALVRLGVIPFLLVQMLLIPPAWPPGMIIVAAVFGANSVVVLSLYVRRPDLLGRDPLRITVFAVDCVAFGAALANYAGPGDLTWVTYILVLLSAVTRWDARGAVAAVAIFLVLDLPLDIGTPAYSHLVFQAGAVTFKVGLITLLGVFFGVQFRSFTRVALDYEAQAQTLRQQTEAVLRSENKMRTIWDTALNAMITMDQAGTVLDWNRRAEEMFGWLKGEVVGRRLSETIVPPQHRLAHEAGLERFRQTGHGRVLGQTIDITALHRSGREVPIELSISPAARSEEGTTFIAFIRDSTERMRTEALQALQLGVTRALAEARSLEEAAPPILEELGSRLGYALAQWWEVDPAGGVLAWKESWFAQGLAALDFLQDSHDLTFAPGIGLPGRTWSDGRPVVIDDVREAANFPRRAEAAAAGLHAALAFPILNGLEVTGVVELFSSEAGVATDETLRTVASVGSQVGQFVERRRAEASLKARDISERKAQTDALQHQALHDGLTGLPNRTLLGDRLRQAVAGAARDKRPVALLVLDLNGFKEVNDSMGHAQGDLILQEVASRIRGILREADTVARLGGDEFAILPSGATARAGAVRTVQKVVRAFEKPFIIDDRPFDIRSSIGVALYPDDGEDAETLMRRADVAMYVAKRGKRSYEFYEAAHEADTALRVALMSELRQAPDRDELVLLYLPKVDLRSDRVVGVEALMRWEHPERGTLNPDQFVPFAEQTEIINALALWVLDSSLAQLRKWIDEGLDLAMAVNMSARNLHDPQLPDLVARLLADHRIPAELLTVEITEGIAMDGTAEERLQQLAAMGVRLSIDDFGTGYSSLAYLKRLPMEELKIDRSFVSGMAQNRDDAAIVRPTIDLAHNLGLRVVAEGVEDQASLDMLRTYGCDLAQGHHISPPLDAPQFAAWLRSPRG
ncbi:MAG: EAL domain-containing protein [Candidatus Dormibacteraeota bacterium]|nr:EAL domain-containing protein [Candidatus Dormibacteraeota bacterium]